MNHWNRIHTNLTHLISFAAPAGIVSLQATFVAEQQSIQITWNKAEEDDVYYMVSIFRDGTKLTDCRIENFEESYTIKRVDPSTEYFAEVWAVNKDGKKGPTSRSTIVHSREYITVKHSILCIRKFLRQRKDLQANANIGFIILELPDRNRVIVQ